MTIEIVLLALASTFRPASLVAVYALVREPSPSRLFTAYVIAGLAFTLAVGTAALLLLGGTEVHAGTSSAKAGAEIGAGVVTLCVGAAVALRRIPVGSGGEPGQDRMRRRSPRRATVRTAGVAGVMTHFPGVFYVIALDLIVSREPAVPGELLEVGIYNAVWFSLPIAILAVCVVNPSTARVGVAKLERWLRSHSRGIVLLITFGTGTWLLIAGLTSI